MEIKKRYVVGSGIILLVAILVGAYAAYWIWKNLGAELLLRDQRASVVVPEPMMLDIDVLDNLDIFIDTHIETVVPVNQTLTLPIEDTLNVMVTFDNVVPIKMNVPLDDVIELDQIIPIEGTVRARVLGKWIPIPIKGDLPVKASVPIQLNVPVDEMVDLQFTAPAKVDFLDDLTVPLRTDISTTIPLKSAMSVPVRSRLRAEATILEPAEALLAEMDLRLPLHEIGLSFGSKKEQSAPEAAATGAPAASQSGDDEVTPLTPQALLSDRDDAASLAVDDEETAAADDDAMHSEHADDHEGEHKEHP